MGVLQPDGRLLNSLVSLVLTSSMVLITAPGRRVVGRVGQEAVGVLRPDRRGHSVSKTVVVTSAVPGPFSPEEMTGSLDGDRLPACRWCPRCS